MNVSDLMEAMSNAGAPMEAIILAVRALEAKDAVIEARRAGDRERKRKQRGTVTGKSRDMDVTVTETAPLDKEKGTQKEINPPRTHTHETPARKPASFACPDGVDPRHWQDFLTNRKRKRCVDTPTARSGVLNDLAKHSDEEWPPGRLVEHAAARGWASINYPDEGRKNDRGQRFGNTHSGSRAIDAGHGFIEDGRHH